MEKIHSTPLGDIHYWLYMKSEADKTLVFLPGLTADHSLFEKQLEFFEDKCNMLVWDAPAHAASYPFTLVFSIADKARWLKEILDAEGIKSPVLVGQSMGGYLSQAFLQEFPDAACGFISIDSCPLQRSYYTNTELWLLKHTEGMYRMYPWNALVRDGANGCAETEQGRENMKKIMLTYNDDHDRYIKLVSHGYKILAEAVEKELPYEISCPALLICGEKDKAGSAKRYNMAWHEKTGLPIIWIEGAGHNSNADKPDEINAIIEKFIKTL